MKQNQEKQVCFRAINRIPLETDAGIVEMYEPESCGRTDKAAVDLMVQNGDAQYTTKSAHKRYMKRLGKKMRNDIKFALQGRNSKPYVSQDHVQYFVLNNCRKRYAQKTPQGQRIVNGEGTRLRVFS